MAIRESVEVGGRTLTFETGAVARQANGAVIVTEGDTVFLAVVTAAKKPTHLPYMPLTVEYRHKLAAAGVIPGSYDRREGRAGELQILTSRIVDRSVRPFFPSTWCYDTQLLMHPLSYEPGTDVPALAITAAAAALNISDIPWSVPLVGVRIVRCDGKLVAFPSQTQRAESDLDFVVSVSPDGIVMIEGGAKEAPEDVVLEAFDLAAESVKPLQELIVRLREQVAPQEREAPAKTEDAELRALVEDAAEEALREAMREPGKHARYALIDAATKAALEQVGLGPDSEPDPARLEEARGHLEALKKSLIRGGILAGERLGGRTPTEIREIYGRAGWLKRCHGSSLFTRGETQALVTCTLGGERDAQRLETIDGPVRHRFLLHYNFPSFSVGEVRPIRGPGRREIGHGHLARLALLGVFPDDDAWPYTVRVESTITESNGSSSMASVCGGSMAMLDAGVPLARPVAGIAMGLVKEGDEIVVLSDILGDEDHVGDMDFKVAGTSEGVTAIQLDNKIGSLPVEVMRRALEQARDGRLHILGKMAEVIAAPRETVSRYARRVETVRIEPARIRTLIGSGGKTINGIRAATGVDIDVEDDGLVKIYGSDPESLKAARVMVHDMTGLPTVGVEYDGRVVAVKDFGSFVRIFEGIEGLLRSDGLSVGGTVRVRVTGVSDRGKLELTKA